MHYSNGREPKVGDIVRGRGYNITHDVIGKVVALAPGSTACNITVACVTVYSTVLSAMSRDGERHASSPHSVQASFEYGQADRFVALDPENGNVLE
jgi:hypothetical protein